MSGAYQLREVFNRGMPTVTYVDRNHLDLERKLSGAVAKGHAIIAITGPSKCGKTVLRKRVIPDNAAVRVEGGQIDAENDFWAAIQMQLDLPTSRVESASKQVADSSGFSGSVGPSFARITSNVGDISTSLRSAGHTFSGTEKGHLLSELLKSRKILVIDDFHYVKLEIRANIVRALKSQVFDGLSVVMLSVPYRAFDVLAAEAEMEGRFTHLTIPTWATKDLVEIGKLGFPVMGLDIRPYPLDKEAVDHNIEQSLIDILAEESMGSPILMQSLCAEVCVELRILETAHPRIAVESEKIDLKPIFIRIAQDFGLPSFEKLARGPPRASDRMARDFTNSTKGDIYEAVLAAVAYVNAPERIPYDAIRAGLRQVLAGDIPQKNEITRSIVHMCEIAKTMQRSNVEQREGGVGSDALRLEIPTVDWKDDVFYLNDVYLRFFLRWMHRYKITPRHGFDTPIGRFDDDIPF